MLKTSVPVSGNMSIEAGPELYIKLEKIDVDYPETIKESPQKNQINICESRNKENQVRLPEVKQEVVELEEESSDGISNKVLPVKIKQEIIDVDASSDTVSTNESASSLGKVTEDISNILNRYIAIAPNPSPVKQYGKAGQVKIDGIVYTSSGNNLIPTQVPRVVRARDGKPTLKKQTNTVKSCDILNIPNNNGKDNTNLGKSSHANISNKKKIILNGTTENVIKRSDTNSIKSISTVSKKSSAPSKTPICNRNVIPSKTPKNSHKKPTCRDANPSNFVLSNGAAFLHSQVQTSPALQSILKDIFTLNDQYDKIDDNSIAAELEELRTKNKLPLITFKESVAMANDSDFLEEDAGQGSDTDTSNSLKNSYVSGNDEENQASGSNGSSSSKTIKVEDDDDCDKLVIDETDMALHDVNVTNSNRHTINKFQNWESSERCLICSKAFRTVLKLKEHFIACSRRKCQELEKTHNESVSRVAQLSSPVENIQPESSGNTFRIVQVVSEAPEIFLQNKSAEIDCEVSKCTYAYCNFEGTKEELKQHGVIHVTGRFYRICAECDTDFFSTLSLEVHFKKTGHKKVRPPIICTQCDFGCFEPRLYSKHMSSEHFGGKRQKIVKEEPKVNDPDVIIIDDD